MAVLIGILLVFLLQPIAALESIFVSDATGSGIDRKSEYFRVGLKLQDKKKNSKNKKLRQNRKKRIL